MTSFTVRRIPVRSISIILITLLVASCSSSPTAPPLGAPATISVISGGDQSGLAGYPLEQPVVVRVQDDAGRPIPGITLDLSTTVAAAQLFVDSTTTDAQGEVTFRWRLGATLGTQVTRIEAANATDVPALTISATSNGTPVRAISGDQSALCAIYTDGRLGCWQVDRGVPTTPPAVHPLDTSLRFTDIAVVYGYSTPSHFCAIVESGRVWCAELHINDWTASNWSELPGAYPAMTSVSGTRSGMGGPFGGTFCGLDQDGGVWCWGGDADGVLGVANAGPLMAATRVAIPDGATAFSMAISHGCAIVAAGTMWCWGDNQNYELGRAGGSAVDPAPAPIDAPLAFVHVAAMSHVGTCGITASQVLYCWGQASPSEFWAQLPQLADLSPPHQVLTGTAAVGYFDGGIFALESAGDARWWGGYDYLDGGSLATPTPTRYPLPFTNMLPHGGESVVLCGRNGAAGGTLCFITEMFQRSPTNVVDPNRLIAFGVPAME